ncbi:MAG: uroporphyrinogen-III synthase [Bacteroidales bacterium]|nr:uroporphyrinogen-III synthase [Bacteroidales bacterium]
MKVKNILVSQPKPVDITKSPYGELSEKYNLNIEFRKFISIEGISSQEFRMNKNSFNGHTAVILTSRHAVDHFFRIAKELRHDIPDTFKYFCNSESIAYYLQKYVQYRKRKIFFGKQTFQDLLELIKKHSEEKFLVPTSDIPSQSMFDMLDKEKINYAQGVIYRTVPANLSDIDIKSYDMLIFFSPAGVDSLLTNFPDYKQEDQLLAAFGPSTNQAIKDSGLRLDIPAPTQSSPSMAMAIDEYITALEKEKKQKKK